MPVPAETAALRNANEVVAYTNSWDHISDELQRLDLLIRLQLLRQRRTQPPNPLDQFRGLVVTETEVASLLTGSANSAGEDDDKIEEDALVAVLGEIEKEITQRQALSQGINLSLAHLNELFQLTPFQQNVLLLALAPQLDRSEERRV